MVQPPPVIYDQANSDFSEWDSAPYSPVRDIGRDEKQHPGHSNFHRFTPALHAQDDL